MYFALFGGVVGVHCHIARQSTIMPYTIFIFRFSCFSLNYRLSLYSSFSEYPFMLLAWNLPNFVSQRNRISTYVSVELRVVSGEACHVHACI